MFDALKLKRKQLTFLNQTRGDKTIVLRIRITSSTKSTPKRYLIYEAHKKQNNLIFLKKIQQQHFEKSSLYY